MMKNITLCADDYGQNQFISQAIIALLEKNRLSATSCMTNMPEWSIHARELRPWSGKADIGLHFNLTEGNSLSGQMVFLPLSRVLIQSCFRFLKTSAVEAELNAQLDAFEHAMGRLPDFVDGYQHIHQLPIIREALLNVYEKRLRATNCYLRCVHDPKVYLRKGYIKDVIIQLLGARAFKKIVMREKILHNSSFSGVYPFTDTVPYSRVFQRFLSHIRDGGMIMCHPGLLSSDESDVIRDARYAEFLYFQSEEFVLDCFHAGVKLQRLLK